MRVFISILFILTSSLAYAINNDPWHNVCPQPDVSYCKNIGQDAYNASGAEFVKNIRLGKITGVSWRPKGSMIGYSEPLPDAGIPGRTHTSPRDSYCLGSDLSL